MPNLETIRQKLLRRRVLVVLRAASQAGTDGWLGLRALFVYLAPEFDGLTRAEAVDALKYLARKNYAETRDLREAKFDPEVLEGRIAPKGIDLVEETIPPDPGVEDDRV